MFAQAAQTSAQLSEAPARRCPEDAVVNDISHEWSAGAAEECSEAQDAPAPPQWRLCLPWQMS